MITYLFKSLYNNAIVVNQRKKRGWWIATIFMIIGVFITIIPILVSGLNTHGSQVMTNNQNYELDRALILFANDQYDAKLSNNHLEVTDTRLLNTYNENGDANPIVYTQQYTSAEEGATPTTVTLLKVYYYPNDPLISDASEEAYTNWLNSRVLLKNDEGTPLVAPRTFMILTPTYYTLNIYNPLNSDTDMTATTSATYSGLFDQIEKLHVLNNGESTAITNLNQLKGANDQETYTNLARLLDNTYETSKINALWINIGLNLGLAVLFVIIGMVCVFIFLRGKTSIYKDVSFLDSMKIAFTFAFTPGVIAMILGFFASTFANFGIAFMFPYGIRIVWLISKSRSNINSEANKPVYQARS